MCVSQNVVTVNSASLHNFYVQSKGPLQLKLEWEHEYYQDLRNDRFLKGDGLEGNVIVEAVEKF